MKKSVSMILCIIMVLLVLLTTTFYLYKVGSVETTEQAQRNIEVINDMEWKFILDTVQENREKAQLMSDNMVKTIERETYKEYPDLSVLNKEFADNTPNTKFSQIIRSTFTGVYMNNIVNDGNDPWAAMSWGISGDFSPNCSKFGDRRTWDIEIDQHANKILAKQAIDSMLIMSDKVIFWEYLPSDDPNHMMINTMSLDELKKVFDSEGINGLKTYEFLSISYMTSKGDIFGVPDVGSGGIKNVNDKVIVSQGFNLYDQLMKDHSNSLKNFDERRDEIQRQANYTASTTLMKTVMQSGMLFLAILALVFIYNKLYDLQVCYKVDHTKIQQ